VKKSWLKRYFVALNAANNFNVVYYDHEPDLAAFEPNAEGKVVPPKKGLKGTMKLAGYTVEKMSGEVGLKLTGGHEAQREWHFKCDSPQDVAEWIPVFQRAAKEAATPQHDDSVIHLSFMDAYKETRWSQSLWGSWHVWGAEDDMLGALLNDILQERLMSEIYDQVPSGPMKNTVLGIIKKTVGGMTRAAATAAWQGVTTTVGQLKSTLVTAAKAVLGPLCEQEPKIVIKVQAAIIDKIQPPIQKLTGDVAAKIFSVVLEPISLFYVCAVKGFTQVMKANEGAIQADAKKLYRLRVNVWSHGSDSMLQVGGCWAADTAMRALAALDALAPILGGKDASSLAFSTTRAVAKLLEKAVYDVERQIEMGMGAIAAIATTTGKLVNDCQLMLETFILEMLGGIIVEPVSEQIKPLIEAPLEPLNSLIPDALKDFLDLQRMAGSIVDGTLVTLLKGIVTPAMANQRTKISNAGMLS